MSNLQRSVNVLLLFADEDEGWRTILLNHLSGLKSEGRIALWDVHQIAAGTDRVATVEHYLLSAYEFLFQLRAKSISDVLIWHQGTCDCTRYSIMH